MKPVLCSFILSAILVSVDSDSADKDGSGMVQLTNSKAKSQVLSGGSPNAYMKLPWWQQGRWKKTCTCDDGMSYDVGGTLNECMHFSCMNGRSGKCEPTWKEKKGARVACATKNLVTYNATMAGYWGGECTCPDGSVYQVGDRNDWCGSLACHGGTPGTCKRKLGRWSKARVDCAQGAATVMKKAPGVGIYGGICTCPDGSSHMVGDHWDSCRSLACYGGTAGACTMNSIQLSRNMVICQLPEGQLQADEFTISGSYEELVWQRELSTQPAPSPTCTPDSEVVSSILNATHSWIDGLEGIAEASASSTFDNATDVCHHETETKFYVPAHKAVTEKEMKENFMELVPQLSNVEVTSETKVVEDWTLVEESSR